MRDIVKRGIALWLIRFSLVILSLTVRPAFCHAQIDAIIDAVVDAVEPTPVYDKDLRLATEDLAGKIGRLNDVLFGGSEQTSGAYRYRTMYSELTELTGAFTSYVSTVLNSARVLERMYSSASSGHDVADAIRRSRDICDYSIHEASQIVEGFKRLFSDSSVTNSEVRKAAGDAASRLRELQLMEQRRLDEELLSETLSESIVKCSELLLPSSQRYAEDVRNRHGSTISDKGSAAGLGTLARVVMGVLSLMYLMYGAFACFEMTRGSEASSGMIAKLLFFLVYALTLLLVFQQRI